MPKRSSRGRGKGRAPRIDTPPPAETTEIVPAVAQVIPPLPHPDDGVLAPAITPSPTLADAVNAVVAQSQRRASIEAVSSGPALGVRRPVPSQWLAAALGGWLVVALLWLVQPAIARGPTDHPWAPAPGVAEPSLRYGLWLAHARVEGFLKAHGRLPSFLEETGLADSSLTLTATGERSYVLEGRQGELRLTLTSGMAADSFLGSSLEALRR